MTLPLLVQPPPQGHISGGYVYNAQLAAHGSWQLCEVPASELASALSQADPTRPVLIDSLWLTAEHAPTLLHWSAQRAGLTGLVLHALPSALRAVEQGLAATSSASAWEAQLLSSMACVVLPGAHLLPTLQSLTPSPRCVVAEPGVAAHFRAAPRARRGPCRFLSVGAVTPIKGYWDVAACLQRLPQLDCEWTVLGSLTADPAYAQRLLEFAERDRRVRLLGQVPPEDVQRQLFNADVLLLPSYTENQPLVVLEALAACVPCVAYAVGAVPRMLEHDRDGYVVPLGDQTAFCRALQQLALHEAERYALAQACLSRHASLLTWQHVAQRLRADLFHCFQA